ncbi:GntR family transcriptional regulator [Peribacillus sp. NPDC006672]|uniref:GntR family transcriptional regulator n=1 Tax=Peribacillus sp. NPDC006672 TaxID=3390606 RepID=UPI003CFCF4F0
MFIEWRPNRPSNISLHQQIVDWMKQQITQGEWPVATKLPSQRSLADSFGVNRSTIITAMDELIADGLLELGLDLAHSFRITHGMCSSPANSPTGKTMSGMAFMNLI